MALSSSSNYNGILYPSDRPLLTADNRGFRYGDGLFETLFVGPGGIRLSSYHFDRLVSGMRLLDLDVPPGFAEKIAGEVLTLCEANGSFASGAARVRLAVFRGESSFTGPVDRQPNYIIQSWPLAIAGDADETGLVLGLFPDGRKACDVLANLKSSNYLLYILAAQYARKQGLDECLVLNSRERLADATIASLFYVRDSVFYTPPLSEGVVDGVMRRYLLEALPGAGYTVVEQPVTVPDLMDADEVFLTNAIRGVIWVGAFQGRRFGRRLSAVVDEQLVKTL
ncbi:aminotransferase class IV [Puia sp. P3]|uniref:aminotransferase class IV n=1 Tax=Puia sp. P3 TaxID=3423952 RepID=UPI003D67521A